MLGSERLAGDRGRLRFWGWWQLLAAAWAAAWAGRALRAGLVAGRALRVELVAAWTLGELPELPERSEGREDTRAGMEVERA